MHVPIGETLLKIFKIQVYSYYIIIIIFYYTTYWITVDRWHYIASQKLIQFIIATPITKLLMNNRQLNHYEEIIYTYLAITKTNLSFYHQYQFLKSSILSVWRKYPEIYIAHYLAEDIFEISSILWIITDAYFTKLTCKNRLHYIYAFMFFFQIYTKISIMSQWHCSKRDPQNHTEIHWMQISFNNILE